MAPGAHRYPIEQQLDWTAKLVPALKMALQVARVYNVAATIGRCFFPAVPGMLYDNDSRNTRFVSAFKAPDVWLALG